MVKKDFQNHFPAKSYSSVSQNIKMRNGLIARKAKVLRCPNFALIFDSFRVTVWAKKKIENIVSIQSYMYDFVIQFEKVCLGPIAPKFEVPQGWPSRVHVSFTLSGVWWRHISKIILLRKGYSSVSQNIKMWNGLIAQKAKVLRCPNFALILDFFKCDCMSKKKLKILFWSKVTCMILLQNLKRCV